MTCIITMIAYLVSRSLNKCNGKIPVLKIDVITV